MGGWVGIDPIFHYFLGGFQAFWKSHLAYVRCPIPYKICFRACMSLSLFFFPLTLVEKGYFWKEITWGRHNHHPSSQIHFMNWFWKFSFLQGLDLYINGLEKCLLELRETGTIKLRTDREFFFLLDHNRQTRIYRLVSSQTDVRLWRNHNFLTEDDDCLPPHPC